jgi:sugar phosphate isomerase/epimerase
VRFALPDGRTVHLGFCTNVLPGETIDALHAQLARVAGPVRARLGAARLGAGLWIAHQAAAALAGDGGACRALRAALDDAGLEVVTLNGFPYGGFHAPRVKERVFAPDWGDPARRSYTLDLATVLTALLPADAAVGTISTVPLGAAPADRAAAGRALAATAHDLAALAARSGRPIRLCLEPEPGAAIETAGDAAAFLSALADGQDREADGARGAAVRRHLGVCFDCCHAAVVGETPDAAFAALAAAGVTCGKVQLSSALVVPRPDRAADRARLAAFDEPRFLHQVRTPGGGAAMDLPDALARLDPGSAPWRVHFHLPIHRDAFGPLGTTAATIPDALRAALASAPPPGAPPHLEVETYTWSVLPEGERPEGDAGLVEGLAREVAWACDALAAAAAAVPA